MLHGSVCCCLAGVGKSSITNEFLRSPDLAVGYLTKKGVGSHMTSTATFHRIRFADASGHYNGGDYGCGDMSEDRDTLSEVDARHSSHSHDDGGSNENATEAVVATSENSWLVDSPGLRDFGLAHMSEASIHKGFPEIYTAAQKCKYRNCRHEPDQHDCAVLAAIQDRNIAPSRYRNFSALLSQHRRRSGEMPSHRDNSKRT
jgi:putative ribosome biogenesis GTPase RsgA